MSSGVKLPEWWPAALLPLEELLWRRRSVRAFARRPLSLQHAAQLLWAAQGVTDPRGLRSAPSAGGLYPLELFLVAGEVAGLPAAVYRYLPDGHELSPSASGDRRPGLAEATQGQLFVADAPATLLVTAVIERTTHKYGERGVRYVHMEAGHTAQNVYLECTALGLATVSVGAFHDAAVQRAVGLPGGVVPLYLLPVGHPA